jgi:hypothetical protein
MPPRPVATYSLRKELLEMNRTKRHLLVLVSVLILLAIPTVAVLAKEIGALTLSGPGIKGEMTLDHHDSMMKLEQSGFFDQSRIIKPPENLGAGYNITAHLNLDGQVVPFVQMVYYASDGTQPGYVHYTARFSGEKLQPVDQWRQLNKSADAAFLDLMSEYKITLQPAFTAAAAAPAVKPAVEAEPAVKEPVAVEPVVKEPAAEPAAPADKPAVSAPNQWILALAASLLVLLGAGLLIRRRAEGQRSSQV